MAVMSSEIDSIARTCVVIECNGMGYRDIVDVKHKGAAQEDP